MNISGMDTQDVLALLVDYYSVSNTLRRRGLDFKEADRVEEVAQSSNAYYDHMRSASYRKLLRYIYSSSGTTETKLLERFGDLTSVGLQEKLVQMIEDEVVTQSDGQLHPLSGKTYGASFEWFVAEIFKREMSGIASFGVKLLNLKTGGDYDVISRLDDVFVFVECKTGSIESVSQSDMSLFIARSEEIRPDFAVFLLDRSGLTEGFAAMCEAADWQRWNLQPCRPKRRRILQRGVFHQLSATKYVVTGEGSLINNLKLTTNHYFTYIKPYALLASSQETVATHYDQYE